MRFEPGLKNAEALAVPAYLRANYWWAYVSPRAVRIFERQWLVNLILWGNYRRLRDAALAVFGDRLGGRSLQIACVYGDLTARWADRHGDQGRLDVVDILPVQLDNLERKLGCRPNIRLAVADSSALNCAAAQYDRALLFFLLHEQPQSVRRASVAEALRALRPGGKLVIVDYHRPRPGHPLWLPMRLVFKWLEPYAIDMWRSELQEWLPADFSAAEMRSHSFFGGLYQLLEITR